MSLIHEKKLCKKKFPDLNIGYLELTLTTLLTEKIYLQAFFMSSIGVKLYGIIFHVIAIVYTHRRKPRPKFTILFHIGGCYVRELRTVARDDGTLYTPPKKNIIKTINR